MNPYLIGWFSDNNTASAESVVLSIPYTDPIISASPKSDFIFLIQKFELDQ